MIYEVDEFAKKLYLTCESNGKNWYELRPDERNTWIIRAQILMGSGYHKTTAQEHATQKLFEALEYFYNISFDLESSKLKGYIRNAQEQAKKALIDAQLKITKEST